jgi:flagellar protein FliO/FliZ
MEATVYLRFVLALILVLGLIMGLAWILKRVGFGAGGPMIRRRRLRVVESANIDGRHRVVLVRRDDVEHLLLVGPNTSQVVERGLPAPAAPETDDLPEAPSFRRFLTKDPQP